MSRKFSPVMSGPDGSLAPNLGRYHRLQASIVYEMNGGILWFADWAEKNPGEFFTKVYPKLIPKEVEVQSVESVDDLLLRIAKERDKHTIDVTPREVQDADGFGESGADDEAEAAGGEDG